MNNFIFFNIKSLILTSGFFLFAAAAGAQTPKTVIKDSTSPCHDLRVVCQNAGYQLNDHNTKGNSLIGDCMSHLVNGETVTNGVTGLTAVAPAGVDLQACAAHIHTGTTPKAGVGRRVKGPSTPPTN